MIKVIDKFKRQYLFFPDITIPSASEGEELHYKVDCFGPCKNIEIKLWVNGEDVDLFAR